jgi:large repetitive protein
MQVRRSAFGHHTITATLVTAAVTLLSACGNNSGSVGNVGSGTMPWVSSAHNSLPYHKTFKYRGSSQTFIVPSGVKKITVVALGAAGGGTPGPRVGRVFAVIPVTPGQRLFIHVGGSAAGKTGGYNGGAYGAEGYDCDCPGSGGGGSSDVRQGGDQLADRVLVAGGAGGQGGSWPRYSLGGDGGRGGGSTGGPGGNGGGSYSGSFHVAEGGEGGGRRAGGTGGAGSNCNYYSGYPGAHGSLVFGGDGGQGISGPGGGGGGGGYYGGGGGGAGSSYQRSCRTAGAGGGGGSSYIEPSATRFQSWQGWKSKTPGGNGLVVFSW